MVNSDATLRLADAPEQIRGLRSPRGAGGAPGPGVVEQALQLQSGTLGPRGRTADLQVLQR